MHLIFLIVIAAAICCAIGANGLAMIGRGIGYMAIFAGMLIVAVIVGGGN